MRHPQRPTDILREHSRRQPIGGIIRLHHHVLFVFELDDYADGSEYLLADDLHVGFGVGEDGGLDLTAFVAVPEATEVDSSAFGFSRVDGGHDALWKDNSQ